MQENHSTMKAFREVIKTMDTMQILLNKRFQDLGISGAQFDVLVYLMSVEKCTHSELGKGLLRSVPNISLLIDRMERNELVKRIRDKQDKRKWLIQLTPKGRDYANEIIPDHRLFLKDMMSVFTDPELAQLISLMHKWRTGIQEQIDERT